MIALTIAVDTRLGGDNNNRTLIQISFLNIATIQQYMLLRKYFLHENWYS